MVAIEDVADVGQAEVMHPIEERHEDRALPGDAEVLAAAHQAFEADPASVGEPEHGAFRGHAWAF